MVLDYLQIILPSTYVWYLTVITQKNSSLKDKVFSVNETGNIE